MSKSTQLSASLFQSSLLDWFDKHGRKNLPWQQNKTPYRVWISEIMLQQTQVATVIPYYERFMQHFPSLETLASADEDSVLHLWAGLGYYSRARHLRRAASQIMLEYDGHFPNNLDELTSLPGIGESTAGAILAIAFNQSATILDGNVKRVLSRFQGIDGNITEKKIEKKLWEIAKYFTPHERVDDYTQAIMDLGATLCTRKQPNCSCCPLIKNCFAYKNDLTEVLPQKKLTRIIPVREATFVIFKNEEKILLQKQPPAGIWGSLWTLPQITGKPDKKAISLFCQQTIRKKISTFQKLKSFRHTFSHYHLDIFPIIIPVTKIHNKVSDKQERWFDLQSPPNLGIPKPVQLLINSLKNS